MASGAPASPAGALLLVCGDDDFAVKQRAAAVFTAWCAEAGGQDQDRIDASAANAGEALRALSRFREAIETLPFFGGAKVVWLKDCNFLGEERTAGTQAVVAALGELANRLARLPSEVRCLISGGKADKRRVFYKAIDKAGAVECFTALSADDKDWASQAETLVIRQFKAAGKTVGDDALAELVSRVGPNTRALASEVEKLINFCGARPEVGIADVEALTTRQKTARAFALGEALGDRDLGKALRALDDELWEIRSGADKKKSVIGLLYGMISKARTLLFLKELSALKHLKPTRDYSGFKAQLDRLDPELLPSDRRLNPAAGNPYPLFLAMRQVDNYLIEELVAGMDTLLEANRRLVGSSLEEELVLQQTLVALIGPERRPSRGGR